MSQVWKRIEECIKRKHDRLDLSNFGIDLIPPEVFKVTEIRHLELSGNHLTSLPSEIRQLERLQTLHLNNNRLESLLPGLFELADLTTLALQDNQLISLPAGIRGLVSLTTLSLYNNKLVDLPSEIGQLKKLSVLNLYNNGLKRLPRAIGQMSALTTLNVVDNSIASIPKEIGELRNLKSLYFARNKLTSLPVELSTVAKLESLYLDDNDLRDLDDSLLQLENLTELTLHGNAQLMIPDSILGPTYEETHKLRRLPSRPHDILHFYIDQRNARLAGSLQPLNAIKVMLVGDGGVGKTSLRRFFLGQPHSADEPETLGIARDSFTLGQGGHSFDVSLWDFAGQEITHALHQFFLTDGCVYLVVVEPRSDNEQNDLEKWLKQIERYGGGSPVIIVLNKQDTRLPGGYDVDRHLLKERFPFIHEFVSTSCGEVRNGCHVLLEQLHAVVSNMPEAKIQVSENWIRIMKELRFDAVSDGSVASYIAFSEFRKLCASHGETDSLKQESLARILHKLGTIVHFIDEPKLRDTTVLNPHWVTDGTYRLLRCKDGPNSNGVITLAEAIVAVPGINREGAEYLLSLMERFEMCFRDEDVENHGRDARRWLIPGALDRNQPGSIDTSNWEGIDRIRIRYIYDPLPQSVIPRFIVMTHSLNNGQACWRNGVVLADGLASALVRKARNENTVEVTVRGPELDRQGLVKVIRGYLDRVHLDLPKPGPREMLELSGLAGEYREFRQLMANERRSVPIVVETADGDIERNATTELNRVSDPDPRKSSKRPLRIFLSYSHEDRQKQYIFRKNLIALENDGFITFWDDPNIAPGMEWRGEIERELESMDVFIGLLTTNFRTSKFIQRVEFLRATERPELQGRLWLLQVDREMRIEGTQFARFQLIRPGNRAVSQYKTLRAGFDAAENEIHRRIVELWNSQPDSV